VRIYLVSRTCSAYIEYAKSKLKLVYYLVARNLAIAIFLETFGDII
jgi:hypothetical protein